MTEKSKSQAIDLEEYIARREASDPRFKTEMQTREEEVETLRELFSYNLGVYDAGYLIDGLTCFVVEGMPDEFKEVISGAVPGVKVNFKEILGT